MKRRQFITLVGGAISWPLSARAQPAPKMPRIGVLLPGPTDGPGVGGFFQGLRELGYIEGQNIVIERRYGNFDAGRFPQIAPELVAIKVDVLVVMSTTPARAAQQATDTIPIVVGGMADPVGDELVANLARPGGNITGNTFLGPELIGKRFGLLKSAIPSMSRVVALWHSRAYSARTSEGVAKDAEAAAQALGLKLHVVPVAAPADLDAAFAAMLGERGEAMVVLPSPMLYQEYPRIVSFAANNRLPAIYAAREFAERGGLMSYGANLTVLFNRAATYVDKILKGAKPADLPVEQPTTIEFIVNLKAARDVGLNLSREFLLLADEVIE
jgi:putative ABC transport system substrate-binding protein